MTSRHDMVESNKSNKSDTQGETMLRKEYMLNYSNSVILEENDDFTYTVAWMLNRKMRAEILDNACEANRLYNAMVANIKENGK